LSTICFPHLKLLEALLSAEYFEVLIATNGVDALEICANGDCDIVLLDVMMPESWKSASNIVFKRLSGILLQSCRIHPKSDFSAAASSEPSSPRGKRWP
jgi:PleD family two-component response regulator